MKEADMAQVAAFIDDALTHHEDDAYLAGIAEQVKKFLEKFPLYPELN